MIVAVAVVGCLAWGERMRQTSLMHRQTARRFELATVEYLNVRSGGQWETAEGRLAQEHADEEWQRNEQRRQDRVNAYKAAMRAKYERLARQPWLPVAPDPPEPE
jgi:hypothetical protein